MNRWKCPACGSTTGIEVTLPAWFRENDGGDLVYLEVHDSAVVTCWYCTECEESGGGEPDLNPLAEIRETMLRFSRFEDAARRRTAAARPGLIAGHVRHTLWLIEKGVLDPFHPSLVY